MEENDWTQCQRICSSGLRGHLTDLKGTSRRTIYMGVFTYPIAIFLIVY